MAHGLIIRSNLNPCRRQLMLINLMEMEQIIKPIAISSQLSELSSVVTLLIMTGTGE